MGVDQIRLDEVDERLNSNRSGFDGEISHFLLRGSVMASLDSLIVLLFLGLFAISSFAKKHPQETITGVKILSSFLKK